MSRISALEALIATEMTERLYAVARSEISRLVAAGWTRGDAVLVVWASPKWPYADETNMAKGLLGPKENGR